MALKKVITTYVDSTNADKKISYTALDYEFDNPFLNNMSGVYGRPNPTILEINHPTLGTFDQSLIGKPFPYPIKGSPFKWKIHSYEMGQIKLEAHIVCGLFIRKIYKFI